MYAINQPAKKPITVADSMLKVVSYRYSDSMLLFDIPTDLKTPSYHLLSSRLALTLSIS